MGVDAARSDFSSAADNRHSVMRAVISPPVVAAAVSELEEVELLVVVSLLRLVELDGLLDELDGLVEEE
jgi:hypothetical protein